MSQEAVAKYVEELASASDGDSQEVDELAGDVDAFVEYQDPSRLSAALFHLQSNISDEMLNSGNTRNNYEGQEDTLSVDVEQELIHHDPEGSDADNEYEGSEADDASSFGGEPNCDSQLPDEQLWVGRTHLLGKRPVSVIAICVD